MKKTSKQESKKFAKKIMNFPGPSAVGRDFMLENLLAHGTYLSVHIGSPVRLRVAIKTTDRPARSVELTKKSITAEEFSDLIEKDEIFAPYVLESNGKRYGYEPFAFEGHDDEILLADASVYQTLALKEKLGDALYSVAVVGSREYRDDNIRARIAAGKSSESEDEIAARLNLGDAHTALLSLMGKQPFETLVRADFAEAVNDFLSSEGQNAAAENFISDFSNSHNVIRLLREILRSDIVAIDEVFVRGNRDHLPKGEAFAGSELQKILHDFFGNALR